MATIKVPYTYTSYGFSEDATKYSQRLAKGKMSWGAWAWFIVAGIAFWIESLIFHDVSSAEGIVLILLLAVPVILGFVAGYYAEKLRTKFYRSLIRKALEEDLAEVARVQPELAAAYRAQLGDILDA